MIYVTGDTHGDKARLQRGPAAKLRRGDTLIVCGDFGFLWSGTAQEQKLLHWIGRRKFNTLFVEGTHDNLDLLARYPVEEFAGAPAHHLDGNLWHLIRGQVYTLEGKTFLAMGGGQSDDCAQREMGVTWWPQELPREEELPGFREVLAAHENAVDYILSHQAPTNIEVCITQRYPDVNLLVAFLDEIQRTCRFKGWFFGSYHQNRTVPPKYHCLYNKVQPVEGDRSEK